MVIWFSCRPCANQQKYQAKKRRFRGDGSERKTLTHLASCMINGKSLNEINASPWKFSGLQRQQEKGSLRDFFLCCTSLDRSVQCKIIIKSNCLLQCIWLWYLDNLVFYCHQNQENPFTFEEEPLVMMPIKVGTIGA
jgi:hypothetical protein